MELHAGMKLRIRTDLTNTEKNDLPGWAPEMTQYQGNTYTVDFTERRMVYFNEIPYAWNAYWLTRNDTPSIQYFKKVTV